MDVVYRYDPFEAIARQNLSGTDEAVAYLERGHNRYSNIVQQVHREMMGGPAPQQIVIPSNPLSLGLALAPGPRRYRRRSPWYWAVPTPAFRSS